MAVKVSRSRRKSQSRPRNLGRRKSNSTYKYGYQGRRSPRKWSRGMKRNVRNYKRYYR